MYELNKKVSHATKGLVRVMAIDGDKVHLRKSGVYFDDFIQNIRPITPKEDCEHLLTDLEKICGERVKKLNPETMYYYNLARYGTLEDLFVIMKRFYLIKAKECESPLTPEEAAIYAFAKDKALHEVSYVLSAPIEEIEPYIKNQLHYVKG